MPSTVEALAVVLAAILPGGLYVWAFERRVGAWGVSFADRLLRFVATSALLPSRRRSSVACDLARAPPNRVLGCGPDAADLAVARRGPLCRHADRAGCGRRRRRPQRAQNRPPPRRVQRGADRMGLPVRASSEWLDPVQTEERRLGRRRFRRRVVRGRASRARGSVHRAG